MSNIECPRGCGKKFSYSDWITFGAAHYVHFCQASNTPSDRTIKNFKGEEE
jgi:hypothetical protein